MDHIGEYSRDFPEKQKQVCEKLRKLIDANLPGSSSKLYHGAPVWFLDGNPILGFSLKKAGIALLFWSGQSFKEAGLAAIGKFKAAEKIYPEIGAIDEAKLTLWLTEAQHTIWNYQDLKANQGLLQLKV